MNIEDILTSRGIEFHATNNPNEIMISCTSGLHEDKSPSLSYNTESHIFNCWSCGFKGNAKVFLESIGVATKIPLTTKQPYKIEKLKRRIERLQESRIVEMPKSKNSYLEEFRGISPSTLLEFSAFTTSELKLNNYLCIPVYQHKKLRFIEGRLMVEVEEDIKSKYYRRPEGARVSDILFPMDKLTDKKHLIMVEGLFDMLNMWQCGYTNTVCIFGATNFNKDKLKVLDSLSTVHVDIMFDGDTPGVKGAEKVANLLDSAYISSRIIKVPANRDPGNLNKYEIRKALNG